MKARIFRLVLGALIPAPLGTVMFVGTVFFYNHLPPLSEFFEILGVAYIVIGIPSIVYSIVMEYLNNLKSVNHSIFIFLSCLSGGSSAFAMMFLMGDMELMMINIGLAVGLITGIALKLHYIKYPNTTMNDALN